MSIQSITVNVRSLKGGDCNRGSPLGKSPPAAANLLHIQQFSFKKMLLKISGLGELAQNIFPANFVK
jgi:hypothetical protein